MRNKRDMFRFRRRKKAVVRRGVKPITHGILRFEVLKSVLEHLFTVPSGRYSLLRHG